MQNAPQSNRQTVSPADTKSQSEQRETMMEIEHVLADFRSQKKELAAKQIEIEKQEATFEAAWQKARKELSRDITDTYEKSQAKPTRNTDQSNTKTLSPAAQLENVDRDTSSQSVLDLKRGHTTTVFRGASKEVAMSPPQVNSGQVQNSKPHPVQRPSPALASSIDRAAHLQAKSNDHARSGQATGKEASLDGIAASLQTKAGKTQESNQSQSQDIGR